MKKDGTCTDSDDDEPAVTMIFPPPFNLAPPLAREAAFKDSDCATVYRRPPGGLAVTSG